MVKSIRKIRKLEKSSHDFYYNNYKLYEVGSWLDKPVKSLIDIIPLINGEKTRILDLGCGVGRNAIEIAKIFKNRNVSIDCVDYSTLAIEKLKEYAKIYDVSNVISPYKCLVDKYNIFKDTYDLIIAISILEHLNSTKMLKKKLIEIKQGIKNGGYLFIIMNSSIVEKNNKGDLLEACFEINESTDKLVKLLSNIFSDWKLIKSSVIPQQYFTKRSNEQIQINTNVITFIVRKSQVN